jgi:hypothetical protein
VYLPVTTGSMHGICICCIAAVHTLRVKFMGVVVSAWLSCHCHQHWAMLPPGWIYSLLFHKSRAGIRCASVGAERLGFVDACCTQSVLCQHRGSGRHLCAAAPRLVTHCCLHHAIMAGALMIGIRCLVSGLICCCVKKVLLGDRARHVCGGIPTSSCTGRLCVSGFVISMHGVAGRGTHSVRFASTQTWLPSA